MKKLFIFCFLLLMLCCLHGCDRTAPPTEEPTAVNATQHGVRPENTGEQNSAALQALIDELAQVGGTIYIPAGEYAFAASGGQTIGTHCIKMRSGICIIGDGASTVLKPVGASSYGLDMFYFNDYLDTGEALYLENCRFADFVIDAIDTSCEQYTSAGKGFMLNLVRSCHWENVTVKNTDATGFGIDCPIDTTIQGCVALGCGKAAAPDSTGASGFGIGFGYCEEESIYISDCKADNNKKFGFFLEHQGRFDQDKYRAAATGTFTVKNCTASQNLFGFGGIHAMNTVYENCISDASHRYGFFFENSTSASVVDCKSKNEREASFAMLQTDDGSKPTSGISFLRCVGESTPIGVYVSNGTPAASMRDNRIEDCHFTRVENTVCTVGKMQSLTVIDNHSSTEQNQFFAEIGCFDNNGNSWN